ncbi:MAG TPA: ABC transporter permease subunit [Candidatus Dormibacteraeota bacterium]|nr:ABC transporter permease subunit [Candidatus Dormibacteraeota bacterium]
MTSVGGRSVWQRRGLGLLGVGGVLLALEVLSRSEVLPSRDVPPVSAVLVTLAEQLRGPALWLAAGQTLEGWAIGLGLALALGVPAGLAIGASSVVHRLLRALVEFLRPIPSVALIPLAVLVYGTGLATTVFLVAFAAFWPILVQTVYGVQEIDPVARDTARAFRLRRRDRLWLVTIRRTLPAIATGLRISSSIALILAVTAELIVGAPGLGSAANAAQAGGNQPLTYALVLVTGTLGLLLNALWRGLERRALRWHPSQRAELAPR